MLYCNISNSIVCSFDPLDPSGQIQRSDQRADRTGFEHQLNVCRYQAGQLVVPKQDNWSLPSRTFVRFQAGQVVVPKQDNWLFPSKTFGGF